MADIDNFKNINDRHGHLAGDYVLKEVARLIQQRIRRDEVLARYGGEEFAIILPETGSEGALSVVRRLVTSVREHQFLAATADVDYSWEMNSGISNMLFGGTGFFIDRFRAGPTEEVLADYLRNFGSQEQELRGGCDQRPGSGEYRFVRVRPRQPVFDSAEEKVIDFRAERRRD